MMYGTMNLKTFHCYVIHTLPVLSSYLGVVKKIKILEVCTAFAVDLVMFQAALRTQWHNTSSL